MRPIVALYQYKPKKIKASHTRLVFSTVSCVMTVVMMVVTLFLGAKILKYTWYVLVCAAGSEAKDGNEEDLTYMGRVFFELLVQDPCCYYRMVNARLRRHAREQVLHELVADTVLFMHPSGAAQGSRKECPEPAAAAAAAAAIPCDDCTHYDKRDQVEADVRASSSTSSRDGADGPKVLGSWKQTRAFSSVLLSYSKVLLAYRGFKYITLFGVLGHGLSMFIGWFGKEGVLNVLESADLNQQGPESTSSGGGSSHLSSSSFLDCGAAARSGDAPEHNSSSDASNSPCHPEELAACCMLALAVVARVAVTYSQMLEDPCRFGPGGNSFSSNGEDASVRIQFDLTDSGRMTVGLLGVVCYCVLKRLQLDGDSKSSSSTGGGSKSDGGDGVGGVAMAGAGTSRAHGSSARKSSSSRGVGASAAAATAASQNWGALQLQLPAPLLLKLLEFEAKVQGFFGPEWAQLIQMYRDGAWRKAVQAKCVTASRGRGACELNTCTAEEQDQLEQVEKQEQQEKAEEQEQQREGGKQEKAGEQGKLQEEPGEEQEKADEQEQQRGQKEKEPAEVGEEQPLSHAMIGLVQLLLGLCEEVMQQVQVPLGCNNPNCTNLEGPSEAAAAKVCTGCHRVHYCSPECIKEHWKEHRPFCKQK